MIKSIAVDLDGTLLNSKKKISEKNKDILKKYYNKGVRTFIVTGRAYSATEEIVKDLDMPLIAICYNGAKAIDMTNGEVLFEKALHEDIVKELIKISREYKVHLNLYQDEVWYVENKNNWETDYYAKNIGMVPVERDFDTFSNYFMTKALFIEENIELKKIEKIINERLGNEVHLTFSQEKYLEVLNKDVNKGKSLEEILVKENLSLDTCIAFGDGENDKEMLEAVEYGVAMKNAMDSLKKDVRFVTDTNENDGVGIFLEMLL